MKKLLTLFAAIAMLFVASCGGDDYDDTALRNELTDLANRVAKLEQLCQQMNTNISSLQTIVNALQQNDFITAVVPVTQGGKVIGYTITFSRSGAITIYHGNDGADGKDGSTPQISVKQDSDGIYYWTLNGEWLLDADGNKIQAEGKDGANGSNGANGVDGITPQLKIEEGYWYISYDNGSTWTQLGKAVGEDGADGSDGIDGSDGQDGDSIFSKVTQDDEFVYFYLSDGTMITLPKHDKENIQFEDLNVKAICCKNWDTNNDGELSYAEAAAVTDIGTTFKGNTNIIAFNELKYFTGLTAIAESAFEGCTNLWKVQLPNTIETIGTDAFKQCTSIRNFVINEGITSIGDTAFYGCGFTSIKIPDSVVSLGHNVFANSSLARVEIGINIINWGSSAFYQTPVTEVIIHEGATILGPDAFVQCSKLEEIILPKSMVNIQKQAFTNCYALSRIYLKSAVPPTLDVYSWSSSNATSFGPYYVFDNIASDAIFYVPEESLSIYQNHSSWKKYKNQIVGYDFEE